MNNFSITLIETLTLYSFLKTSLVSVPWGIFYLSEDIVYMYIYIYNCIYIYIYIYVHLQVLFAIMNIPCTQGDRIHIYIYIYINHYDENLLNIFLICFLKPSCP